MVPTKKIVRSCKISARNKSGPVRLASCIVSLCAELQESSVSNHAQYFSSSMTGDSYSAPKLEHNILLKSAFGERRHHQLRLLNLAISGDTRENNAEDCI